MSWDKTSVFLGLGVGLAIGSLTTWRLAVSAPPEPASTPTSGPAVCSGPSTQELIDGVTLVLREELQNHYAHNQGTNNIAPISDESEPPPAEIDPELVALQAAAKLDGEQLITSGIGRGRWTDEDGEELTRTLRQMSEADADETRRRLTKAINARELAMEAKRPF